MLSGIVLLFIGVWIGYFIFRYCQSRDRLSQDTNNDFIQRLFSSINRRNRYFEIQDRNTNRNNNVQIRQNTSLNNQVPSNGRLPASSNNINETEPMIYFANNKHGLSDKEYQFKYKKVGNSWRAYILRMPSLNNRSSASGVIHRLQDSGGYYICWDRQVNTLKDIQIISRRWADSIQEYISTGRFG